MMVNEELENIKKETIVVCFKYCRGTEGSMKPLRITFGLTV